MYLLFLSLIVSIPQAIATEGIQHSSFTQDFAQADLYWGALLEAAHGHIDLAKSLAAAFIRNESPVEKPEWKQDHPARIDDFFDRLFLSCVASNPQTVSELALLESIGLRHHNAYLDDASAREALSVIDRAKKHKWLLQAYSNDTLTPDQKLSYKILLWSLDHTIAGERFWLHDYKINQMDGILIELTALFTLFHQIDTKEDVFRYLARMDKVAHYLHEATDFLKLQEKHGIVLPPCALEKVIDSIDAFLTNPITDNTIYSHLAQQMDSKKIDNAQDLLKRAYHTMDSSIYPAYRKLQGYLGQLRGAVTTNNGVWALPDGDAYYAYMLEHHTTTNLSADQIHALGMQQVEEIHRQMRVIFNAEGLNDDSKTVGALMRDLSGKSQFYYQNNIVGKKACLADLETILERSRTTLGPLFGLKPDVGVTIQSVPSYDEDGAPGAYYRRPGLGGMRPGAFFVNMRDMNELPTYGLETLTIHEAEPGHHFQLALQYTMDIPLLRKIGGHTAYCEGWALYAEKLAYEYDFYSSSFTKLGHLQDELLRAVRLVVDTGIHHKRWTYEYAISYMQEATGYHRNSVLSEIERYFVLPGQACAYKIGQLKILELRQRARQRLGSAFSIVQFHDVILQVASAPLTIIEEVVDEWIKDQMKK